MMKEAGLGPLVAAISTTDPLCHRFASLALANLATNVANQITIVQEGAVRVLIDVAADPSRYGCAESGSALCV